MNHSKSSRAGARQPAPRRDNGLEVHQRSGVNHRIGRLSVMLFLASIALWACGVSLTGGGNEPPGNALVLRWVYSTSVADWANASAADFNNRGITASDGRPIWIEAVAVDAGQAVSDMIGGAALPDLWTTADTNWRDVLHEAADSEVFLSNCVSVAQSPLVIAMWEPVARALGWPSRTLGWLDVASLAADPSGWAYYSGGAWGETLRLGHAHPGLSDSGVQTLLALVYAAESSRTGITADDVENPIVQASVGAFESAVSWFSPDTAQLADTLLTRGLTFLNAAVMYENEVVMQGERAPRLVAIYPFEGTFMATYPTCVRAGMDEAATGAAETVLAYMLDTPAQERALSFGLRPASATVPVGAPIDAAHGADPVQPAVIFSSSEAAVVFAIQDLWQSQRKNVNLAMVLDVSGSMEGDKIIQVRESAIAFVEQMGDNDRITVIVFADRPQILVANTQVGGNRQAIIAQINTITAGGGTSLFDTIAFSAEELQRSKRTDDINAMVVLTDGQDTVSQRFTSATQQFSELIIYSGVSVYTIAYGEDADQATMQNIALATNGIFFEGDVSTIGDIYAAISAAFGGSLGIGR
ncbi:MAG: VWA domain-containing protein [Anaerolineae bacterium]|nr:VWA domain-containing protein [Anaerolineae bacterium]